jgi:hypothetical protein
MVELGKIQRPEVESFSGKRKLYFVPNVYPVRDAEEEYNNLVNRFWEDVEKQLERLEIAGRASKILCESIYGDGEEALNILNRINERAHSLVKKRVEQGAVIQPIEDRDILNAYIDWRNCLAIVRSREVSDKIYEFYKEALDRRLKHLQNAIDSNISAGEAAILIMEDDVRVKLQLSKDIELFLVMPPSYDDIMRWLRDRLTGLKR